MPQATSTPPGPTITVLAALALFVVLTASFALSWLVSTGHPPDVIPLPLIMDDETEQSDPRGPLIDMSVINPIRPRLT